MSAQLRVLSYYARKNGYAVAREYVDEAEGGRVPARPEFRRTIEEVGCADTPFREILKTSI